MKTVISVAFVLTCAFSLDAQITTTLNRLPDGTTEGRLRNNATVSLAAFAISVNYTTQSSTDSDPLIVYVDPEIDAFPAFNVYARKMAAGPLLPNQEFTWLPGHMVAMNRKNGKPIFDQPIAAGIFSDGSITGEPALLTRLMLRRSNMLLAVETAFEALSEAGRHNIPKEQLIKQFRKMADSLNRWYLPQEQQVGRGLYQSIVGKLMSLPEGAVGSPFPPSTFVAEETAMLHRRRVALLGSQPSLADIARIGR